PCIKGDRIAVGEIPSDKKDATATHDMENMYMWGFSRGGLEQETGTGLEIMFCGLGESDQVRNNSYFVMIALTILNKHDAAVIVLGGQEGAGDWDARRPKERKKKVLKESEI
ncbi:hypothetical protein ACJX0J_033275, partial [Zea mays]